MEAGALTGTMEEKQPVSGPSEPQGGTPKEPVQGTPPDAGARAKEAKPAVERKRSRNLSEDKRVKLFSGTANRPLAEEIALRNLKASPELVVFGGCNVAV